TSIALKTLGKELSKSLEENAEITTVNSKTQGEVEQKTYVANKSKLIIDEIDRVLAGHYGFTEEELDFIINYDIKYRMGLSGAAEEEQDDVESMQRPNKIKSTTTFTPQPFTTMIEFAHDEGIYTVKDVMDITGISRSKVKRWFTELSNLNYEGISLVQQGAKKELCISFYGLVELVVINHLREEKFQLTNIWKARNDLGRRTGKMYPFATNNVKERMKITGQDLVFQFNDGEPPVTLDGKGRRSGQFNMDFIQDFFRNMDFSDDGHVLRFYPHQNSRLIVVDPKQGGGKATISGKGAWAETIAGFYKGPESVPGLMRDYGLTEEEISIAVEYWN
nr:DUF433 domain-containing protein [Flavipsychrobacter sp.]